MRLCCLSSCCSDVSSFLRRSASLCSHVMSLITSLLATEININEIPDIDANIEQQRAHTRYYITWRLRHTAVDSLLSLRELFDVLQLGAHARSRPDARRIVRACSSSPPAAFSCRPARDATEHSDKNARRTRNTNQTKSDENTHKCIHTQMTIVKSLLEEPGVSLSAEEVIYVPMGARRNFSRGRKNRVNWQKMTYLSGYFGVLDSIEGYFRRASKEREKNGWVFCTETWHMTSPFSNSSCPLPPGACVCVPYTCTMSTALTHIFQGR